MVLIIYSNKLARGLDRFFRHSLQVFPDYVWLMFDVDSETETTELYKVIYYFIASDSVIFFGFDEVNSFYYYFIGFWEMII